MNISSKQKLTINYTDTLGYRKSIEDSPAWADSYKVTESLARKFNVKTMAEVGVARGHHSAHLLEAIDDLTLYVVDPWDLFLDEYYSMWKKKKNEIKKEYESVVALLKPFKKRSIILKTTSKKAIKQINQPLDMVFIDADHTYESVKQDIGLWWGKIRVGGIISGHDYGHTHHPGVKIAVDEYFGNKNLEINQEIGTVWWVQKKQTKTNQKHKTQFQKIFYNIKIFKKYRVKIYIINTKKYIKKHYTKITAFIKLIIKKILGKKIINLIKK